MSAIFLPRRWRHQPQGAVEVDWRNPLTRNLIAAFLPSLGAGYDVATKTDGGAYGKSVAPRPSGQSLIWTPGGGLASGRLVSKSVTGVSKITVVIAGQFGSMSGSGYRYFTVPGMSVLPSTSTTGYTEISGARNNFPMTPLVQRTFAYSATMGTSGWVPTVYVDGAKRDVTVTSSAPSVTFTGSVVIGSHQTLDRLLNADVAGAIVIADDLGDAGTRELSDNPWQIFRAPSHRIWFDVGAGAPAAIEGDVVAEESGADTLAATGSVVVAGSLAAAETGADTFAATGGAVATGTLAAGEAGADALVGTGKVLVAGSLAATETAHDTFSASGAGLVAGTLAAVESGADTITVAGKVVVSGALSVSETGTDTWAATGAVRVSGSLSASETGVDTFSSTGEQPAVAGDLAASEIGTDGFSAVGSVPAIGSFDLLEAGHDTLTGSGQIIVAGVLGAVESGEDSFYSTPAGSISGLMAAVEAADSFSARGHGRSAHGVRMSADRGYQSMTMGRPVQRVTTRRPRQRG